MHEDTRTEEEKKAGKWELRVMDDRDPRLIGSLVGTILGVEAKQEEPAPKHPSVVPGYEDPKQLAKALCVLNYEDLAEYVMCIHTELVNDSAKDKARGRTQLAGSLQKAADAVRSAYIHISNAAAICKNKS